MFGLLYLLGMFGSVVLFFPAMTVALAVLVSGFSALHDSGGMAELAGLWVVSVLAWGYGTWNQS